MFAFEKSGHVFLTTKLITRAQDVLGTIELREKLQLSFDICPLRHLSLIFSPIFKKLKKQHIVCCHMEVQPTTTWKLMMSK